MERRREMESRWDPLSGAVVLRIAATILIGCILCCICIWPTNTLEYDNIAVDSTGRLYMGERLWIGVYEDGQRVDELVRGNHRYYEFTIIDDQIHFWGTENLRKIYDLDGNLVERRLESHHTSVLSKQEKRQFTTEDGSRYELENGVFKRARVVRYQPDGSEEIVFRTPLGLYLAKLAFVAYLPLIVLRLAIPAVGYVRKYWRPGKAE